MNIFVSISLSFGIAFIVWKVIVKKGKAKSSGDYALKWFAFGLSAVIATSLPRVLSFSGENDVAVLLVSLILIVPCFALVGWVVGKISKIKVKNAPKVINEKTSNLVNAVKHVTGDVQGAKLVKGLAVNLEVLSEMDDAIFDRAVSAFVSKRELLRTDMKNMSSKGCIQTGQKLQIESKKIADLDKSGSCALWLAGAWLESLHRTSDKAKAVHFLLEKVTLELNQGIKNPELMEKSVANSAGNDGDIEALYFKRRVRSLKDVNEIREFLAEVHTEQRAIELEEDQAPIFKQQVDVIQSVAAEVDRSKIQAEPKKTAEKQGKKLEIDRERYDLLRLYNRLEKKLRQNSDPSYIHEVEGEFMDNRYYQGLIKLLEKVGFIINFKGEYWLLSRESDMDMLHSMNDLVSYALKMGDIELEFPD